VATDQELAEQFLNNIRADIITRHVSLGQRASGETISKLRAVSTPLGGILFGPAHIFALDRGRGPTRGGGGGGESLQKRIYDWLAFSKYGLSYSDNKQRTSLSWAIATKIHKKGTNLFQRGGGSGLLTNLVTSQRLDALTGAFLDNKSIEFRTAVLKNFKGARQA